MSLSIAEARAEIAQRYQDADAIERKYPGGPITDNADQDQVRKLLTEIDDLEERLSALEDTEQRRSRILQGVKRYTRPADGHRHAQDTPPGFTETRQSIGAQFASAEAYREAKERGLFNSPSNHVPIGVAVEGGFDLGALARKALMYSGSAVGGALVVNDTRPGVTDLLQRELTLLDIVPRTPTTSDTIEYVREDSYTNAAAPVAEASVTTGTTGTKPESAFALSTQTSPVRTIAHWIPVTNRMLADAPAIRGMIDNRLLYGLEQELEDQIVAGDGTGENLTGILSAGIQTYGAGSSNNVVDAIFHGRTMVRVIGHARPNAVAMHPNDWEAVRLMRENAATGTLGGYLMGPPSVPGPMTIFGMPVVEVEGLTENTAVVGDFVLGCMLFDREQGMVRTGYINDQFIRNMQTLLAEGRWAFVVFRPTAFCRITGV